MDVRLPDGRILRGIPEGTTKAQIAQRLAANGIHLPGATTAPSLADTVPSPPDYNAPQTGFDSVADGPMAELKRTGAAFADPLIGAAELGASGLTNVGAKITGGLAGLVQGTGDTLLNNPYLALTGKPLINPMDSAANRSRSIEEALTYQPGRRGQEVGAGIAQAAKGLYDKTGLPTLTPDTPLGQTLAPAVGDAVATLSALPKVGSGLLRAADAATIAKPKARVEPVPKSSEVAAAADEFYKASDAQNVVIRPESTQRVVDMIDGVAKRENLGRLPPKIKEARDVLAERIENNEPLSLRDADKVRQLINDAKKSTDPADQRLGMAVQKPYDSYLDNLAPEDTLTGNKELGLAYLKEARKQFKRRRDSEMLDEMERQAALTGEANYTQGGVEHAMRRQYLGLAKDTDEMKRLSPEQRAAIEKVAAPGRAANGLRNLSKMDPTRGGMAAALNNIVGGGTGAVVGGLVGGLPGAAAGGLIGKSVLGTAATLAGRAALRGTLKRAATAREALIGRGLPNMPAAQSAAPAALSGELMARPPLALPAPTIISGPRSAPGSMYARQQMGMTPDVEAAGMQHPGMARQSVPPQPKALPYLPEQPVASPMVVDPRGRVAPSADILQEYLRQTGQERLGNVRQPSVGTPDNPLRIPETATSPKGRPKIQVQADLRALEKQIRNLTPDEQADFSYMRVLSHRWAQLQDELASGGSRAASGPGAASPSGQSKK